MIFHLTGKRSETLGFETEFPISTATSKFDFCESLIIIKTILAVNLFI